MTKLECLIGILNTVPLNNITTALPLELLHHFKYLSIASANKNFVYLATPKGYPFDACFVDRVQEKIISTIEFKCVQNDVFLGPLHLKRHESKYSKVDFLDLGFLKKESFDRQLDFLVNEYIPSNEGPKIEVSNFSSSIVENACTPLFEKQALEIFTEHHQLIPEIELLTEKLLG